VQRSREVNNQLWCWRQMGRVRRILDDARAGSSGFTRGWRGARRLGSLGGTYRADRGTRLRGHDPGSGKWSPTGARAAPVPRRGRRRCGRKHRRPGRLGHLRRRARPSRPSPSGSALHSRPAGRAPELGHADDQCLVEKPATVQILEQRSVGPVGRRDEHLLEPQGFLGVAVPAGIGRRLDGTSEPVDVYQPDSALHQAAGEQHTLAERSLSIEVPVALGLILKAKCSSGLRGAQQIERPARLLRRTLLPVTCDRRSRDAAGSRREDS